MCPRALRACVLTCQRAWRAYVLTCQRALRACDLRVNVPSLIKLIHM